MCNFCPTPHRTTPLLPHHTTHSLPAATAAAAVPHGPLPPHPHPQYIPNFLNTEEFAAVLQAAKQLSPQLRKELNCIAVNRRGCYVPDDNIIAAVFSSKHVAYRLQQVSMRCRRGVERCSSKGNGG